MLSRFLFCTFVFTVPLYVLENIRKKQKRAHITRFTIVPKTDMSNNMLKELHGDSRYDK